MGLKMSFWDEAREIINSKNALNDYARPTSLPEEREEEELAELRECL